MFEFGVGEGNLVEDLQQGDMVFNGVNGVTGEYGLAPMPTEKLARLIQGKATPEDVAAYQASRARLEQLTPEESRQREEQERRFQKELDDKHKRGQILVDAPAKEGVDPKQLNQAGWAVVFPAGMDPGRKNAIQEALSPLLNLRQGQAEKYYQIFGDGRGYRPNERKDEFFKRHNISAGPADPAQMAFYVLLVGSPEEIPYQFQYQLDVMRGVGRLDFGDDLDAYARYAQSVVLAETGKVKLARNMTFFGVQTKGDKATELSSKFLIRPLYENLKNPRLENEIPLKYAWNLRDPLIGDGKATRAQLGQLLGGDPGQIPALLVTASHGMEFPNGHNNQLAYQGALLCQDWPGPSGGVKRDYYFAGEDIAQSANLLGLIAMFFACYGAGTPQLDQFALQAFKAREPIAPQSFVAALPNRMLKQGALAVIGHVERAWGYSFISPQGTADNQAFVTALRKLLNGDPIGLATDPSFNLRYADMSSALSANLEELQWTPDYISEYELAHMWTANNDARGYVVIGDPAAKVPFAEDEKPAERPSLVLSLENLEKHPKAQQTAATTGDTPMPQESKVVGEEAHTGYALGWPGKKDEGSKAEGESKAEGGLLQTFQNVASELAEKIGAAVEEITSLEVNTYTSSNLESVVYDAGEKRFQGQIKMRARTYISFDGDMEVCLPVREDGSVDRELWQIHSDTVKQAQINRTEFLKTVADLAARLMGK